MISKAIALVGFLPLIAGGISIKQSTYPQPLIEIFEDLDGINTDAQLFAHAEGETAGVQFESSGAMEIRSSRAQNLAANVPMQVADMSEIYEGWRKDQSTEEFMTELLECKNNTNGRAKSESCSFHCRCVPKLACSTMYEDVTEEFRESVEAYEAFEHFRIGVCTEKQ